MSERAPGPLDGRLPKMKYTKGPGRLAQLAFLYARQNGRCGICAEPVPIDSMKIDHDHRTDLVRGALCHRCNIGLGWFNDNNVSLHQAVAYVEGRRPSCWRCGNRLMDVWFPPYKTKCTCGAKNYAD